MKDWFTHELPPFRSLMPELSEAEFELAVAANWGISGRLDDGLALFGITRDREQPDYWHIAHVDAPLAAHGSTERPVRDYGVVAMCAQFGDVDRYTFTFQDGARPDPDSGLSVYFIQPVGGGLVKIGVSKCPGTRLVALQTGCPVPLEIVKAIPATRNKTEREIHRAFAEHRVRGEWFSPVVLTLELPQ